MGRARANVEGSVLEPYSQPSGFAVNELDVIFEQST